MSVIKEKKENGRTVIFFSESIQVVFIGVVVLIAILAAIFIPILLK